MNARWLLVVAFGFSTAIVLAVTGGPTPKTIGVCELELMFRADLEDRVGEIGVREQNWISETTRAMAESMVRGDRRVPEWAQQRVAERLGIIADSENQTQISKLIDMSVTEISRADRGGEVTQALKALTRINRRVQSLQGWLTRVSENKTFCFAARTVSRVPGVPFFWQYRSISNVLVSVRSMLEAGVERSSAEQAEIERLIVGLGEEIGSLLTRAAYFRLLASGLPNAIHEAGGRQVDAHFHSQIIQRVDRRVSDLLGLAMVLQNARFFLSINEDSIYELEDAGRRALDTSLPALRVAAAQMSSAARGMARARDLKEMRTSVGGAIVIAAQLTQQLSQMIQELERAPILSAEDLKKLMEVRLQLLESRGANPREPRALPGAGDAP